MLVMVKLLHPEAIRLGSSASRPIACHNARQVWVCLDWCDSGRQKNRPPFAIPASPPLSRLRVIFLLLETDNHGYVGDI